MYCSKCGKKILDDSIFCSYCGNKIKNSVEDSKDGITNIQEVGENLTKIGKTLTIFVSLPIFILILIYLAYTCSK